MINDRTTRAHLFQKGRIGKKGSGILAYVNDRLCASLQSDLMENNIEILWIEVCPFKSKRPVLVAVLVVIDLPPSTRR